MPDQPFYSFKVGDIVTPIENTDFGAPRNLTKGESMQVIDISGSVGSIDLRHSDGIITRGWSPERFKLLKRNDYEDEEYKELFI